MGRPAAARARRPTPTPSPASAATSSPSCSPTHGDLDAGRRRWPPRIREAARAAVPPRRHAPPDQRQHRHRRLPRARRRRRDAHPAGRRRHVQGQALRRRARPSTRPSTTGRASGASRCSASCAGAVAEDEFVLHYQPFVDLRTGERRAGRGAGPLEPPEPRAASPPVEFIELAEVSGVIQPLTRWVLAQTASAADRRVATAGPRDRRRRQPVGAQPLRPRPCRWLGDVLREAGLDASMLMLELTESELMDDPLPRHARCSASSRRSASATSIDDFGTGYSSLTYLQEPADRRAQDRPLVRRQHGHRRRATSRSCARPSTSATTSASRWWPRASRTRADLELLRRARLRPGPGLPLSHPVPADELLAWLADRSDRRPDADALDGARWQRLKPDGERFERY